jgi:hypothetical protein
MSFAFLYRDTTLSSQVIAAYKPGMTIIERGFTDVSTLRGGPAGSVRYLVATDKSQDLSIINPAVAKWGLRVIQRDSLFRVLDVFSLNGRTQVLLSTYGEEYDAGLTKLGRADFSALISTPPVAELATPEWQERVAFPVGVSDEGVPFPLPQ